MEEEEKTTRRHDRKIKAIASTNRKASCTKLSVELARQGVVVHEETMNKG